MALMNCPECNKEISDMVEACPHCGYPVKKKRLHKITPKTIGVLLIGIILLGIAFFIISYNSLSSDEIISVKKASESISAIGDVKIPRFVCSQF
ncbi:MAG: zinc-ribbon domain-containing protein, partial [Lachnospiraceae bacterium]|nr:zinc-ribbon domain-containing protein [Lachnospiraceae bacterium]